MEEGKNLSNFTAPTNDGTNACAFLSLKITELLLGKSFLNWDELPSTISNIIRKFPTKLNEIRDKEQIYEVEGAYAEMLHGGLVLPLSLDVKYEWEKVFSDAGKKQFVQCLESDAIYIMTVQPYSFVVGRSGHSIFVVDTHVIGDSLGGNGNGVIVVFSSCADAAKWVWQRLFDSKVRDQFMQLIKVTIEERNNAEGTVQGQYDLFQDSIAGTASRQHNISKECAQGRAPGQYDLSQNSKTGTASRQHNTFRESTEKTLPERYDLSQDSIAGTASRQHDVLQESILKAFPKQRNLSQGSISEKNQRAETATRPAEQRTKAFQEEFATGAMWDSERTETFGPYNIPYIPSVSRNLTKVEQFALVKSKITRAERIPQACRKQAVFLINSSQLKATEDVQSDLNGTFEKCLEVRIYTVQAYLSDKDKAIVKAISRKRMEKLGNNQMYLKLHRKENKFGLIRNISYFFVDGVNPK